MGHLVMLKQGELTLIPIFYVFFLKESLIVTVAYIKYLEYSLHFWEGIHGEGLGVRDSLIHQISTDCLISVTGTKKSQLLGFHPLRPLRVALVGIKSADVQKDCQKFTPALIAFIETGYHSIWILTEFLVLPSKAQVSLAWVSRSNEITILPFKVFWPNTNHT